MSDLPPELDAESVGFDAGNVQQVKRRRTKAQLRQDNHNRVVIRLMADPMGRAWLWDLLVSSHSFQTSFVRGDPYMSAFREGERNQGLQLLAQINRVAPEMYAVMAKENSE